MNPIWSTIKPGQWVAIREEGTYARVKDVSEERYSTISFDRSMFRWQARSGGWKWHAESYYGEHAKPASYLEYTLMGGE